jgi:hypothetical protein
MVAPIAGHERAETTESRDIFRLSHLLSRRSYPASHPTPCQTPFFCLDWPLDCSAPTRKPPFPGFFPQEPPLPATRRAESLLAALAGTPNFGPGPRPPPWLQRPPADPPVTLAAHAPLSRVTIHPTGRIRRLPEQGASPSWRSRPDHGRPGCHGVTNRNCP